MRKWTVMLTVLVASFLMSGCGKTASSAGTKEESRKDTEAPTEIPVETEPELKEPFTEFNKDSTYKDVIELFKDQIHDRTEKWIDIDGITVLGDITGSYTACFNEGNLVEVYFSAYQDNGYETEYETEHWDETEPETENNVDWNESSASKIVEVFNEMYGESDEEWYGTVREMNIGDLVSYNDYNYYTIRKWVNYDGQPILLRIHKAEVSELTGKKYDYNDISIYTFYSQDKYDSFMDDYTRIDAPN